MKRYKLIKNPLKRWCLKIFRPREYNRLLGYEAMAVAFRLTPFYESGKKLHKMLKKTTNLEHGTYKWFGKENNYK